MIGIVGGWRRGGKLDSVFTPVFIVTSSVPYFWVGLMGVLIFSVDPELAAQRLRVRQRRWCRSGRGTYAGNVLQHALLPAATILITSIGTWILTMRNNMITVLAEDYVRMGRAKGLSSRRVMVDYAARNAMLPNLTGFAMSLGFVVSGAILVEYVFDYPGVGFMLLQAAENEDYALMQGLFLLITVAVLLGDPRLRHPDRDPGPAHPDAGLSDGRPSAGLPPSAGRSLRPLPPADRAQAGARAARRRGRRPSPTSGSRSGTTARPPSARCCWRSSR